MDDDREIMRKVIKKGKVNGLEASYVLAILGAIVLDVVHGENR